MPAWLEILVAGGAYAGTIVAVIIYLHGRAGVARDNFRVSLENQIRQVKIEVDSQLDELSRQTKLDHNSVQVQVRDLGKTISEAYVMKREFDSSIHNVNLAITEAQRQIINVGRDVANISQRMDRFLERVAFFREKEER